MADRYVIQSIRRLPMFQDLPAHEVERLAGYVTISRYEPNAVIFRQWDVAKGLYMLIDGRAVLVQQQQDGSQRQLAMVGANQFLNEGALTQSGVESASLVVVESAIVLLLTRQAYQQFLQAPRSQPPMRDVTPEAAPPPLPPAGMTPPPPPHRAMPSSPAPIMGGVGASPLPQIDPTRPPQIVEVERARANPFAVENPAPDNGFHPAPAREPIPPPQDGGDYSGEMVGGQGFFEEAVHEEIARFEGQSPTEQVIHMTRRHFYAALRQMWKPTLVFLLMLVAGTFLEVDILRVLTYLLAFVFPGLMAVYYYFDWRNDWLIITDERVLHIEKDILRWSTRVSDIPVKSVQVVKADITDTLVGRVMNFGRLEIKTAGGAGNITMKDIPKPDNIQDYVFKQRTRIVENEEKERQRQLIQAEMERIMGKDEVQPIQPEPVAPVVPPAPQRRGLLSSRYKNADGDTVYRRHWIVWFGKVFVPSLVLIGGITLFLLAFTLPDLRELGAIVQAFALFIILAGGIWTYLADWDWRNDLYIIGDKIITVIHRRPLWLHYQDDQILLDRIDNTTAVTGGILRTFLNYGNVKISLIGDDKPKIFDRMPDPRRMREEISQRQARARQALQDANDKRHLAATLESINAYHKRYATPTTAGDGYPLEQPPIGAGQSPFGDHTRR